jgi:BMFP domain-containing protein YqiC
MFLPVMRTLLLRTRYARQQLPQAFAALEALKYDQALPYKVSGRASS